MLNIAQTLSRAVLTISKAITSAIQPKIVHHSNEERPTKKPIATTEIAITACIRPFRSLLKKYFIPSVAKPIFCKNVLTLFYVDNGIINPIMEIYLRYCFVIVETVKKTKWYVLISTLAGL